MELEDSGEETSKEYMRFLNAMSKELRRIAGEIEAKVKWCRKQDYTLYAMLCRKDNYIYLEYSNATSIRGRTFTDLTCNKNVTLREAFYEGDTFGGNEVKCTWDGLKERLEDMFDRMENW